MNAERMDLARRGRLCSRAHADRVALQIAEHAGGDTVVLRTGCAIQPWRVASLAARDQVDGEIELQVVTL